METTKYVLVKRATNKGFHYKIETAEPLGPAPFRGRNTAKEFIACTVDGEFFFTDLKQIGKGNHGKSVRALQKQIENSENALECAILEDVLTVRQWVAYNITDINEPLLRQAIEELKIAIDHKSKTGILTVINRVENESLLDEVSERLYKHWDRISDKAVEILFS